MNPSTANFTTILGRGLSCAASSVSADSSKAVGERSRMKPTSLRSAATRATAKQGVRKPLAESAPLLSSLSAARARQAATFKAAVYNWSVETDVHGRGFAALRGRRSPLR